MTHCPMIHCVSLFDWSRVHFELFSSFFQREKKNEKKTMQRLAQQGGALAMGLGTALGGLNALIFNVDPGCRAVMFDRFRGVLDEVYDEGKLQISRLLLTRFFPNFQSLLSSTQSEYCQNYRIIGIIERSLKRILGTHIKIPFVQTPIIYDAKTIPKTLRTSTGSKDLQTVNLSLRVLYRCVFCQEFFFWPKDYGEF